MKLLQSALIYATVLIIGLAIIPVIAQEPKAYIPFEKAKVESHYKVDLNSKAIINKKFDDKILNSQAVNFVIVDSLFNAYSYFATNQTPFTYYAPQNTLITITRGYAEDVTSTLDNRNNLFIITSNDWGKTWNPKILAMDAEVVGSGFGARYPNVFPMIYDNTLSYVYSAPVTNAAGWYGVVDGILQPKDGDDVIATAHSRSFTKDGSTYWWTGSDTRVLGYLEDGEPVAFSIADVLPDGGVPLEDCNNIGRRISILASGTNISDIPPAFTTDKFYTYNNPNGPFDSVRQSEAVSLKYGKDGKMYFAARGDFVNGETGTVGDWEVGVSTSADNGQTWSEFDIMPYSVVKTYASSMGLNPDTAFLAWPFSYTLLDNGNMSFVCTFYEGHHSTVKDFFEQVKQIIELYKENGTWGVRKIADCTGEYLPYRDSLFFPYQNQDPNAERYSATLGNQMRNEVQISRTVDGSKLLCKWIDLTISEPDNEGNRFITASDIYMSYRDAGSNIWSNKLNITNTEEYDKITWLPDLVPNDLKEVPIIRIKTIPNATDTGGFIRARQQIQETPQYLMVGIFDATISSVDDEPGQTVGKIELSTIYPNPANKYAEIAFSVPSEGFAKVEIYNIMGEKVMDAFSGVTTADVRGIRLNTESLPSGIYYCTLIFNGQKVTKSINIIH